MRHIGLVLTEAMQAPVMDEFVCPHCGKIYKSPAALKAHCTKEHPDDFDKTEK